jgi:hypothetical protein
MPSVAITELPPKAFLQKYKQSHSFTDCYMIQVSVHISQATFVEAFYTSALFKIERTLLHYLAKRPASNQDAAKLASGGATHFSAWRVEAQDQHQLLLADFTGRTRSWLMAEAVLDANGSPHTKLYFGSAVIQQHQAGPNAPKMGFAFNALLGFHKLYSRLLLRAAVGRIKP